MNSATKFLEQSKTLAGSSIDQRWPQLVGRNAKRGFAIKVRKGKEFTRNWKLLASK